MTWDPEVVRRVGKAIRRRLNVEPEAWEEFADFDAVARAALDEVAATLKERGEQAMTTDSILRKAGYFIAEDKNGIAQLFHALSVESITPHTHPEHGLSIVIMKSGTHHPCRETCEALIGLWQLALRGESAAEES